MAKFARRFLMPAAAAAILLANLATAEVAKAGVEICVCVTDTCVCLVIR
ncbi:MAG: hypothetical protein KatS3mg119_2334 [Rhodothalassiaceae bacterium]|nr:MAG: hypothetical protein KatS3mg119_2334 [Rhodothalassiaceae bacterium]